MSYNFHAFSMGKEALKREYINHYTPIENHTFWVLQNFKNRCNFAATFFRLVRYLKNGVLWITKRTYNRIIRIGFL